MLWLKTYSCLVCIMEQVELSHPNAELRLLEVFYHKIYKVMALWLDLKFYQYNSVLFLLNTDSFDLSLFVELITQWPFSWMLLPASLPYDPCASDSEWTSFMFNNLNKILSIRLSTSSFLLGYIAHYAVILPCRSFHPVKKSRI